MGLYDTLELPAAVPLPDFDGDPSAHEWQTKSIGRPLMRTFRITPDGRLLQEETRTEEVPEEERPAHGTDAWEEPLKRLAWSIRTIHEGWTERRYHGVIRFYCSTDDDFLEYEAKCTDGRLVAVRTAGGKEDAAWIPLDLGAGTAGPDRTGAGELHFRQRDLSAGAQPGDEYKRTARLPLDERVRRYDVDPSSVETTGSPGEESSVQLFHLPDKPHPDVDTSDAARLDREVYEVALREPKRIAERDGRPRPVSLIVEHEGPYGFEEALERATALAERADAPIVDEIARLRPTDRTDAADWVTCPGCGGAEIVLVSDLDSTGLTLACRACDARSDSTDRQKLFQEWLHCPGCASGDVNVEVSAPGGSVWWSCDDCRYDTSPGPTEPAYPPGRIDG